MGEYGWHNVEYAGFNGTVSCEIYMMLTNQLVPTHLLHNHNQAAVELSRRSELVLLGPRDRRTNELQSVYLKARVIGKGISPGPVKVWQDFLRMEVVGYYMCRGYLPVFVMKNVIVQFSTQSGFIVSTVDNNDITNPNMTSIYLLGFSNGSRMILYTGTQLMR
jgi:hypothetical protein